MGIQPSRTKTRVRTKRTQHVDTTPTTVDDLIIGAGICCVPVTIAHYQQERLVGIYRRHVGRRCAPQMETVDVKKWRSERGLK